MLGAAGAGNYTHFLNAYQTIFAREGVRGLFRGYWASNFTWWPWNIIYFVVGVPCILTLQSKAQVAE